MFRACGILFGLLLTTAAARASPYWIEYEPGNGYFPEEVGWTRYTSYGGDQRSIEDGWLIMDGMASPGIYDYALMAGNAIDPGPGALFVCEWRVFVSELTGPYDPGVAIHSDDKWAASFVLSSSAIYSLFEPEVSASFEPGIAHTFEFQSADMRTYILSVDGAPAINGSFWESLTGPAVAWGDRVYRASSAAYWDYFRFGVTPECGSLALASALGALGVLRRSRARR
jgi:hypothetical protein